MKLFLGSVTWRTEEVGYSQSMRQLVRYLDARKIEFTDATVVGDALVSRARSIAGSAFLRSDADVMVSIDSDIWFRPEDVVTLAEKAKRYGIIAALYMTRSLSTQPALMLPPGQEVIFGPGRQPIEVPYASTGFVAVARRVFERMSQTLPLCHQGWTDRGTDTSFWPFYMPFVIPSEGEGHIYLSEDWAFCERAKQQGDKVWLDPSIRLGHIGSYMYTLEDLIRPPRTAAAPLSLQREADGTLRTEPAYHRAER